MKAQPEGPRNVCKHGQLARSCEICELERENTALRKDAERYRWLRDKCNDFDNPNETWILGSPGFFWDTAIDAARKEKT
jgi:hypothetical protein